MALLNVLIETQTHEQDGGAFVPGFPRVVDVRKASLLDRMRASRVKGDTRKYDDIIFGSPMTVEASHEHIRKIFGGCAQVPKLNIAPVHDSEHRLEEIIL